MHQITDDTAGLDVVGSDLERLVDALKFSQTGARPKPDHLSLLGIQLKSARRTPVTPLGDFRDTAGQTVLDRLGVRERAAVVQLCAICIHVRMNAVFFRHSYKILDVCSETKTELTTTAITTAHQ